MVTPLEGRRTNGTETLDAAGISDKSLLSWVSLIRQPDFVTPKAFEHICLLIISKKPELASSIERGSLRLVRFSEGACAQIMHKGPYDDEPATIAKLADFVGAQGLSLNIGTASMSTPQEVLGMLDCNGTVPSIRLHHEIYLGDPRRTKPENLKTVIRHPVA